MASLSGPRLGPASQVPARQLVMLLHGYGSNGEDLIQLAPFWQDVVPHAAFVAPNAPQICEGAPDGYQWWPLHGGDPAKRMAGVSTARPLVDAFIDEQLAHYGLGDDKLALVGFSQGTMVALHVGLRRARQLAGIIGFSGVLADPETLDGEMTTRPPVLLVHGDADPVVSVQNLPRAAEALSARGVEVTTHVSPGLGHSIDIDGIRLAAGFLKRVLG